MLINALFLAGYTQLAALAVGDYRYSLSSKPGVPHSGATSTSLFVVALLYCSPTTTPTSVGAVVPIVSLLQPVAPANGPAAGSRWRLQPEQQATCPSTSTGSCHVIISLYRTI